MRKGYSPYASTQVEKGKGGKGKQERKKGKKVSNRKVTI